MALPVRDDRQHPLLARARPLGQLQLDRLEQGPGRAAYGPRSVGEVQARTALTDFFQEGACWSLNPYTGCLHDCVYCYVPDTMRAERERWGSYVLVKTNLPAVLRDELHHKARRPVFLSSATDAWQPVEREQLVTRRCLEVLARHDWPLHVLTRSPLVLRDLDLLSRFSDVEVGLSVPTLDDRARAILEPGAPPIQARLDTLRQLADAGFRTFANYSPAYPLTGGVTPRQVAETLRDAGVQWVNTNVWIYLDGVAPATRRRVEQAAAAGLLPDGMDELPGRIADPVLQQRLQSALQVAFEAVGLPLHRMRMDRDDGTRRLQGSGVMRFRQGLQAASPEGAPPPAPLGAHGGPACGAPAPPVPA